MIGKYQMEFNEKQITAGAASSDYASDGGIAPSSILNPLITPGIAYGVAADTGTSNAPHGNIIATCEDVYTVPYNRILFDDAGYFYYLSGTTLTAITNMATPPTFNAGATDLAAFGASGAYPYYLTYAGDIAKLTYDHTTATLTKSWWQGTKTKTALATGGGQLNPLLVYQKLMWVADGNYLHNWDSSESINTQVLILSANEIIYALGIDPSTGLMLISHISAANASGGIGSRYWVSLYDGYSSTVTRRIEVPGLVTSFKTVGGRVYCGMESQIGVWNGSGITFLRQFSNITYDNTRLIYKNHIDAWKDKLLVVDGKNIWAYGSIKQSPNQFYAQPVWWCAYQGSYNLTALAHVGSGVLVHPYYTGSAYKCPLTDLTSKTSASGYLRFPYVNFPRPVIVRRVRIFTTGLTSTSLGSANLTDENSNSVTTTGLGAAGAAGQYVFDYDFNAKLQSMKLEIPLGFAGTTGWGVVRAIVYYDTVE